MIFKWYDTPFLHIIQYLEVCRSPRRQNRNSCPCTGEDYAASFKCRAQYLRCLTNYHFMKRKKTFQLQGKAGSWVSRQQITNAGCIWTRKRDSVCFPTGVSPHWLLKDVYNNYTNKETAVRLGGLRPWLHKQNNTILWSICSACEDSLYKLFPASRLCSWPQCDSCPAPFPA